MVFLMIFNGTDDVVDNDNYASLWLVLFTSLLPHCSPEIFHPLPGLHSGRRYVLPTGKRFLTG